MPSIRLPETFDRQGAESLLEVLRAAHDARQPLVLDASGVERIGQSGLQLLLSAARTASENGLDFKLSEPSEALSETLALTGLSTSLLG